MAQRSEGTSSGHRYISDGDDDGGASGPASLAPTSADLFLSACCLLHQRSLKKLQPCHAGPGPSVRCLEGSTFAQWSLLGIVNCKLPDGL